MGLPSDIVAGLRREARSAQVAIPAVRQAGHPVAGLDRAEVELRQCLEEERLSRPRHPLTGYHACERRELAQ